MYNQLLTKGGEYRFIHVDRAHIIRSENSTNRVSDPSLQIIFNLKIVTNNKLEKMLLFSFSQEFYLQLKLKINSLEKKLQN